MEGTFGSDGELKKTGPSDVKTAEGLGASNIKGVDDPKTSKNAEADTGKVVPEQHISNKTHPRVGTDPASRLLWISTCMRNHACTANLSNVMYVCSCCYPGSESVVIDAPESGRTNQGQGNNTSSGREDYIDQSRQGAK